jgi:hypothetical protein
LCLRSVQDGNQLIVQNVATNSYQTVATRQLQETLSDKWYNLTMAAYGDSVMCYLDHVDATTGNLVRNRARGSRLLSSS